MYLIFVKPCIIVVTTNFVTIFRFIIMIYLFLKISTHFNIDNVISLRKKIKLHQITFKIYFGSELVFML